MLFVEQYRFRDNVYFFGALLARVVLESDFGLEVGRSVDQLGIHAEFDPKSPVVFWLNSVDLSDRSPIANNIPHSWLNGDMIGSKRALESLHSTYPGVLVHKDHQVVWVADRIATRKIQNYYFKEGEIKAK